ncbi:mechanosensitive ion channel family protein [Fervidibacter sacchari]|uniref:Small-conductance mechanosensitive channel n=1 Tax=Candidatus Fervidibacter sacchari TaxID=1448929 RepID=A0ABT2ESH7_9BACT|nr:mechanosensitive ion channel family protein [Candidatus Fervidibacter sacchari]MCS3920882.1 small-conductance mechanosensitive channel [Candidatus Fervidibacter sacchari]WKU17790.1 mechanosensitive ion channel family protein [Candidatus Fervidibacter sacchari]
MALDLQSMLQPLLLNIVGWFRFWFLPRVLSAAVIIFIAYLLSRWFDGMWHKWLRPALISSRERSASQSVWRQVRILSLPRFLTRVTLSLIAGWMIAERFGVPREIVLWGLTIVIAATLWCIRHLLSDLVAGYSLVLDDALAEGDQISSPLGEGVVERISWFAVYLRSNDGVQIVIPHRAIRGNVIKVRRPITDVKTATQIPSKV